MIAELEPHKRARICFPFRRCDHKQEVKQRIHLEMLAKGVDMIAYQCFKARIDIIVYGRASVVDSYTLSSRVPKKRIA